MPQQQQQPQQIVRPPDQITFEMRMNYFKEPPVSPRIRLYVFAGLLVFGIIVFHNLFWTLVFVLCLIPIVWRFVKWMKELNRPTMTDREYDQWIWGHVGIAEEEGRNKFRIAQAASEVQAKPQTIRGFVYPKDADAKLYNFYRAKKGEDGRFRSSVSRFIVLYLAEHELCIYIRDINALGQDCVKKDSSHYYEMVTSISMDTYGHFGANGNDTSNIMSADYFAVTMTSGHNIGMAVLSRDDLTERTVADLRKLLGAKKYGRGQGSATHPGAPGGYSSGYSGVPGGYPGVADPYPGNVNGYPGVPSYPGNSGPYPGVANPYSGNANGYPGVPNSYPGNTGPYPYPGASNYPGVPNSYPGNTGPYPYPGASNYPGVPNSYPGNVGPFPGANSYPGVPNPYSTNTDPNSGFPNPYSTNTDPNSGFPNPYPGISNPAPENLGD